MMASPLQPHSPAWYDRLATLQEGYYYPWKSTLAEGNGEAAYLELVRQHLKPDTDLLEIACGHGEVAVALAHQCRRVFAYDRIDRYIRMAQQHAQENHLTNIEFVCADSSAAANHGSPRIPAEDHAFDLLISRRGPLHWIADVKRVARPGAWLIQLNPLETPLPPWADQLPEPLRSATRIEYTYGMLNAVRHNLQSAGIELHSAWTYDVPEYIADPQALYIRLSWGYLPNEVPSWEAVAPQIQRIFQDYAGAEGLVMRHTRLLWTAML